ncbi:MAG: hypothetical protein V4487_07575 [Chlamydiota bacterium]
MSLSIGHGNVSNPANLFFKKREKDLREKHINTQEKAGAIGISVVSNYKKYITICKLFDKLTSKVNVYYESNCNGSEFVLVAGIGERCISVPEGHRPQELIRHLQIISTEYQELKKNLKAQFPPDQNRIIDNLINNQELICEANLLKMRTNFLTKRIEYFKNQGPSNRIDLISSPDLSDSNNSLSQNSLTSLESMSISRSTTPSKSEHLDSISLGNLRGLLENTNKDRLGIIALEKSKINDFLCRIVDFSVKATVNNVENNKFSKCGLIDELMFSNYTGNSKEQSEFLKPSVIEFVNKMKSISSVFGISYYELFDIHVDFYIKKEKVSLLVKLGELSLGLSNKIYSLYIKNQKINSSMLENGNKLLLLGKENKIFSAEANILQAHIKNLQDENRIVLQEIELNQIKSDNISKLIKTI